MLKRIENRLLGCSSLLSSGDKLTPVKFVFSIMSIFFMCTLMVPKTVVKQINSYLMNCFWRRFGTQERGSVLISWNRVCQPKMQGGLGVLDIHTHNQAFLMKFLQKLFNRETPLGLTSSGKHTTRTINYQGMIWLGLSGGGPSFN